MQIRPKWFKNKPILGNATTNQKIYLKLVGSRNSGHFLVIKDARQKNIHCSDAPGMSYSDVLRLPKKHISEGKVSLSWK